MWSLLKILQYFAITLTKKHTKQVYKQRNTEIIVHI